MTGGGKYRRINQELEKEFGKFNELLRRIRNRQSLTIELDEAIRSWHSDRYKGGYFVLTDGREVIPFETKEALDGFLIQQLENETYSILLANSFSEWDEVGQHQRHITLMQIIEEQEEGQNGS